MFARKTKMTLAVLLLSSAVISAPTLIAYAQGEGPAAGPAAPADDPLDGIVIPGITEDEPAAAADDPLEGIDLPGITDQAESPAAPAAEVAAPAAPAASPSTVVAALPPDLVRPADPIEAAAFDALMRNCARCHQDGMLIGRLRPNKNFGNVLVLSEIAADPSLVIPGNPDGSELIKMMSNEMPYDVFGGEFNPDATPPTEDEMAAIRAWIEQLGTTAYAACETRDFITPTEMVSAMASDLETLQPTRVADTRYITLTHLYNACATDEEMDVYRQAVVKLLNSLSSVSDVVRLETVDEHGTIVRFNLKDVGWESADWDRILSVYPYGAKPDTVMFDLVSTTTLSMMPYIRGDWFAFSASQPPLYEALLDLPENFAGLQELVNVDVQANLDRFIARRAGFQDSGVSQHNRLIERHPISTGYFWTSYDFAGSRENQSLFEFPLGPGGGDNSFHHDGGETIYSLPNGFQAYYLNTADGARLEKGPTEIVRDLSRVDLAVTNGISCMGCHDLGIRDKADEIRTHVLADRTFDRAVRDAVEALYPEVEEMNRIFAEDKQRFLDAMVRAGLGNRDANGQIVRGQDGLPTFPKLNGLEMINALAAQYENDVDLRLAAAEFGLSHDAFIAAMDDAPLGEAIRLSRRLDQGVVPRDNFEPIYKILVESISDDELLDLASLAGGAPIAVAQVADERDFAVTSNKSAYAMGDNPIFTVTTDKDCFLTLINVDGAGTATVIYPNAFEQENHITTGKEFTFPSADAPFDFAFTTAGEEKVIAICTLENHPVDQIAHNFTEAAFTDLGDYNEHVAQVTRARAIIPRERPAGADAAVVAADAGTPAIDLGDAARSAIVLKVQ